MYNRNGLKIFKLSLYLFFVNRQCTRIFKCIGKSGDMEREIMKKSNRSSYNRGNEYSIRTSCKFEFNSFQSFSISFTAKFSHDIVEQEE